MNICKSKKNIFCSKNRGKVYKYLFEKSRKRDLPTAWADMLDSPRSLAMMREMSP